MTISLISTLARVLDRWIVARLTPAGAVTNLLVFFLAASTGIYILPESLLDWSLFAFMALVFVTEGVVMTLRVRVLQTWKTSIAVIIGVRYVLGLYFLFAAVRQIVDQERAWPDVLLYEVRAFVLAWLLLELTVIPYVSRNQPGIVTLLVDQVPRVRKEEQP